MLSRSFIIVLPATAFAGADRIARLSRFLGAHGCAVEVLTFLNNSDRQNFGGHAPITSVQHLPTPAVALASNAFGDRARQAIRGWGLRRWLAARPTAGIIIGHPRAASVLRYDIPDRGVVAMLPAPSDHLEEITSIDLHSLEAAKGWLVCNDHQASAVDATFDRPSIRPGPMILPSEEPRITAPDRGGIVLIPDPARWSHIDHAVEVAFRLRHLDDELTWIAHGPEDRWLAQHDVEHIGRSHDIRIMDEKHPDVLVGASLVVRTGYRSFDSPIVVAARRFGLPVIGFSDDATPGLARILPFDVESLVAQVEHLREAAWPARGIAAPDPGYGAPPDDLADQVLAWTSVQPGLQSVRQ